MWQNLNYYGLILGLAAFLIIGVFHPLVIKAEYHFGKKIWWVFLAAGIIFSAASVLFSNNYISIALGVTGFSAFWSVHEVFKQHERVMKGRAKMKPGKEGRYKSK